MVVVPVSKDGGTGVVEGPERSSVLPDPKGTRPEGLGRPERADGTDGRQKSLKSDRIWERNPVGGREVERRRQGRLKEHTYKTCFSRMVRVWGRHRPLGKVSVP